MSRLLLVLLALCVAFVTLPARADTVLLACSDECSPALFEALELELRGHGGVLVARPAPAGFTPSARGADALRLSQLLGAGATLWIEHEAPLRVRAYSAKSGQIHEAPLSTEVNTLEPKLFAAVAGSVALEALAAKPAPAPPASIAPGAAQLPSGPEAAAGPVVAPGDPVGPGDLKASQQLDQWKPLRKPSPCSKRFFVRVGAAFGFAVLGTHTRADRPPSAALVAAAAAAQGSSSDLSIAERYLFNRGYDCKFSSVSGPDGSPGVVVSNCHVAVRDKGLVTTAAIDLATGLNLTPRVALAATVRIDPTVGRGTLASALIGLQTEIGVLSPKPTGVWLSVVAGLGGGQIQAHPPGASGTPWASSGLGNARLGMLAGYRFLPRLGIVVSPTVHLMFPETLWVFETNLHLEVRI